MTVRERLLAISLMEKEARNPQYAARIGIHVSLKAAPAAVHVRKEKK